MYLGTRYRLSQMPVNIRTEDTPNPNARRFVVDRPVQEQSRGRFFRSQAEADEPLAKSLLGIDGAQSVMFLPNSITVNKSNSGSWDTVQEAVMQALREYFD